MDTQKRQPPSHPYFRFSDSWLEKTTLRLWTKTFRRSTLIRQTHLSFRDKTTQTSQETFMKISYSFGIVDLLHYGHINTLLQAKKGSDYHVFGLVSDEASLEWMGSLVSSYEERKKVMESLTCVDAVVFQKTLDPLDNIKMLHKKHPNATITLYHGNNWKIMPSEEYLKSLGGSVVFTQYYEKLKPENILKALNQRKTNGKRTHNLISTKANTLMALKQRLKLSKIEDLLVCTVAEYQHNPSAVCAKVAAFFGGKSMVVRSSSSNEDSFEKSNAGHYESVLNVHSASAEDVSQAIEQVIASYTRDGEPLSPREQILLQTQTLEVAASGVIFTRDINQNRPYYLINYDESGSTDSVTSGSGGRCIWIARDAAYKIPQHSKWQNLIASVQEIEKLFEEMVLDIEFAINSRGEVIIFQVRPLAANYKYAQETEDHAFFELKKETHKVYAALANKIDNKGMILSDMAFWNPSEIIGSNPRNLDYSLYREIITKRAWNEGLVPMGYKKVPHDLMYRIANKPYISLEYSFFSLIPASLDHATSLKLMQYYRKKLLRDISSHDKIEFEIALSCFDLETKSRLQELVSEGFTEQEIQNIHHALFTLTEKALLSYFDVLEQDTKDLELMQQSRKTIEKELPFRKENLWALLEYFKTLIGDIKRYGTPQFARQARYAFIAKALCRSMVSQEYFSDEEMESFMLSITTVASEFEEDFHCYLSGELATHDFNTRYGHLRSGTYDIRARRYDQIQFDRSSGTSRKCTKPKTPHQQPLNTARLTKALHDLGFGISPETFLKVLASSFEQREYFKFEFTKSLSLAMEIVAMTGSLLEIDREFLSYLEMPDLLASGYYMEEENPEKFFSTIIRQRRKNHDANSRLILPEVLAKPMDLDFICISELRPNFITKKTVQGELVFLEEELFQEIQDAIVVITKADPGFDWIFAKGIKGLITKYGGAASHMAIRCAEFGIPAAIGCGEKIYETVSTYPAAILDCKNGKILQLQEKQ